MEPSFIRSSLRFSLTVIPLLLPMLLPRCVSIDERFAKCAPFNCGNITNVSYPFSGNGQPDYCGYPGFQVDCTEGNLTLDVMTVKYQVFDINPASQILKIAIFNLLGSSCPSQYFNTTWNTTLFDYTSSYELAALLYNCSSPPNYQTVDPNEIFCPVNDVSRAAYFMTLGTWEAYHAFYNCSIVIEIPVVTTAFGSMSNFSQAVKEGFEVRWTIDQDKSCTNCVTSGGRCGYNGTIDQFRCFCRDQAYEKTCPSSAPAPSSQVEIAKPPSANTTGSAGTFLFLLSACVVSYQVGSLKH